MSGRILAGFLAVLLMMVAGAAEPTRVVQAEEILEKIELGQPVEYDNVIVVGDLNLSGLNLTRVPMQPLYPGSPDYGILVTSPIIIINSVIDGSVYMNGTVFQDIAVFEGTRFKGPAFLILSRFNEITRFSDAQFKETANFWMAQFNQTADFSEAQFNQITRFTDMQFKKTANFENAQFKDIGYFLEARFNQTADFSGAQFNQTADFSGAQFDQTADFTGAQFIGTVEFRETQFNQTASFWNAKFIQTTYFTGAQFNGTVEFIVTQFNQTALFWEAQFNQTTSFAGAQFNKESYFSDTDFLNVIFNYSLFSKEAFFDGAQINGTLFLYRTKYDTLNIRWSSIHDLAYDDTAYHLLIQNFNKLGFSDDASECQYSYRCKHREELFHQHKFDSWLFDLLAWATYGYGLRPVRPLGWAALLILMGGMFFFLTGSVARSRPSPSEKRPIALCRKEENPDGSVSIWEALLLSATYFTSGASSIISATPSEFVPVGPGRYVVVALRLLGWIFFVLFLSSLTRTV